MSALTLEEVLYVSRFYSQNTETRKLYNAIREKTIGISDYNAIYKMTQHTKIAEYIYIGNRSHKIYFNLSDAIIEVSENNVLLYIKEISIYILFANKLEYTGLNTYIVNNTIPDSNDLWSKGVEIPYSPYQIILSTQKQKMMFRGLGDEQDIQLVRKFCEELFKCDTTAHDKEITVNMTVNNLQEVKNSIEKLDKFLRQNSSFKPNSRVDILPPIIETISRFGVDIDYTSNYVGTKVRPDTDGLDLLKLLKYGFPETITIINNITTNNTITNSGDNVNISPIYSGNGNTVNSSIKVINPKEKIAKEWIGKNLPNDGDSTSEIYNRYKIENPNRVIASKIFNSIMKDNGYENIRDKKSIHRWYKI
jgi:hypothetical protein